jgi:hypothetical protein
MMIVDSKRVDEEGQEEEGEDSSTSDRRKEGKGNKVER